MAAEYCNWLSQQEGISENQWVYEPNDDGKYAEGMRIKETFLELRGYRLPTVAEWEHACRAGTSGTYGFGEPVALLEEYGWYVLNSLGRGHPVESLLPNDAGLFDMHGNLWEWTQDPFEGPLSPVVSNVNRVLRGGAFSAHPSRVRSDYRHTNLPDDRHVTVGFRPARTYHLSP
jgi:formylglycine-generating enzyme required for sulfatase activity